jgi:transposase
LRNKIPELGRALEGRVTAHHRFLLRELLDHLYFVESKMRRLEEEVAERLGPFQSEVARLCTIPGVDRVTAWGLLAEIGLNMNQFPNAQHLASWTLPGESRERGQAQEREDPQRKLVVAALPVPSGLGRLDEEEQLSIGLVSSIGSSPRR